MPLKKFPAAVFLAALALSLASCFTTPLHSGRQGADHLRSARITVFEGSAVLTIRGRLGQDLYAHVFWGAQDFNQQVAQSGAATRNETRRLSAGEEIAFWLMPSEVVSVNIAPADENDVKVVIRPPRGEKRTRVLSGANRMGLTVSF